MTMATTTARGVMPFAHDSQKPKHYGMAQSVMKLIIDDLPNVGLDPKEIKTWQLVRIEDEVIVLATLNINIANPEKYEAATHRIQTIVRDRLPWAKAAWVNSTGWRWAIRISRVQPLPKLLPFPGVRRGMIQVGRTRNGKQVEFDWHTYDHHVIISGMTRSGKSAFTRLFVYQAFAAGAQVMIADMKERTFLAFEHHPELVCPIAATPQEADALIDRVYGEIEHRKRLFNELSGLHEKLTEYNMAAVRTGRKPLPRLLVVLDEYLFAINALGGVRGKFAQKVWDIVRIGLAYGVQILLTTQDIGKDDLGGLRDQFGTVICFRTKNAATARNLEVGPAATIPDGHPGMAYCDPFGWVQCYYQDKSDIAVNVPGESMSAEERQIVEAAAGNKWRVTRSLIQTTLGIKERQARAIQEDLALRGWLVKSGEADNAFMVSERWKSLVGPGWTGLDAVGPVGGWTQTMPGGGDSGQAGTAQPSVDGQEGDRGY